MREIISYVVTDHIMSTPEGSMQLLRDVRARFIVAGSSLKAWCDAHGVNSGHAKLVLAGERNGPKAKAMRRRIVQASERIGQDRPAHRPIARAG